MTCDRLPQQIEGLEDRLKSRFGWGFIIKDERDFESEKKQLLELIKKFNEDGPAKVGLHPHPVFGKFTSEQWGKSMWKHLDHHLKQFGA